jgi:hypothetical protein
MSEEKIKAQQEKIKECYKDREIKFTDGSTYQMLEVPYRDGMKIASLQQKLLSSGEVGSDEWFTLSDMLMKYFTVIENGVQCVLSKLPGHFDKEGNKKHYITFVTYAAGMVTHPFTPEN